ncbi:MAG: hypothetical protein HY278_03905 [candidate division NC10 bacterium]|nr:hypothetical protein [candidate division NC10 bacterium]
MTGRTGIFYHPSYSQRSYLTVGRRLSAFPGALKELRALPHVLVFEAQPVSDELILMVHTPGLIEEVAKDPL